MMGRTALSLAAALMVAVPVTAGADAGAGKPSPAPRSGDGIVYNAGGCPAGQIRQYPQGGAGPGSDCGTWKFDDSVIAYVHKMSKHNLHWICAVPFASCDEGGASRSMEIFE
jgi:hypothetical protein